MEYIDPSLSLGVLVVAFVWQRVGILGPAGGSFANWLLSLPQVSVKEIFVFASFLWG